MSVTSKCTPNVSQNEHENKCTQMYKNVFRCRLHLHTFADRVLFLNVFFSINVFFFKCTQMYSKCTPKCTFRFPGFSKNSGNPNVPKCTFAYISNVLQMYPQMYPGCTFRFPEFSQNSGNPNVPKCTFSYI